jgi:transposase-like protein
MSKYSTERKLEAVHAYLKGIETFKEIAQKYKVSTTSLKEWVARFREHGLATFQTYTNYSIEFKMDVLTYMKETGASTTKAASVFNIPSSSTVWNWKYLWETKGINALEPKKKGRPSMEKKEKKQESKKIREEKLQAEIEYL